MCTACDYSLVQMFGWKSALTGTFQCPMFSVSLVMIDFLDDANKYTCKNRTAPSDLPAYLLLCQIWNNYLLLKLSVHVSNYTRDTEDICLCIKLYQRYMFVCTIIQELSVCVSNLK